MQGGVSAGCFTLPGVGFSVGDGAHHVCAGSLRLL